MFLPADYPQIVSGLAEADDAAVVQISDDLSVIFTTDFFTPIVDDPYLFGAIAAANAVSDVYAMGGEVTLALNISCFPKNLPEEMIREILRGGAEKVKESGGAIAGGHTVDDEEPKYGLAVMGVVRPGDIFEKTGAEPGDQLVLTKPLGTGIITTAIKGEVADPVHIRAATDSMSLLNRTASQCLHQVRCHAATDVTGFGLAGHALEIGKHSRTRLRIHSETLPFLPGSMEYADMWLFPAGANNNRHAYEAFISFSDSVPEEMRMLVFTPETSGGLLASIHPDDLSVFIETCRSRGLQAWHIGEVESGTGIQFD